MVIQHETPYFLTFSLKELRTVVLIREIVLQTVSKANQLASFCPLPRRHINSLQNTDVLSSSGEEETLDKYELSVLDVSCWNCGADFMNAWPTEKYFAMVVGKPILTSHVIKPVIKPSLNTPIHHRRLHENSLIF